MRPFAAEVLAEVGAAAGGLKLWPQLWQKRAMAGFGVRHVGHQREPGGGGASGAEPVCGEPVEAEPRGADEGALVEGGGGGGDAVRSAPQRLQ